MRLVSLALALALAAGSLHATHKLRRKDMCTPAPVPRGSLLIVGFLGGWEDWDNNKRSVRKLALRLRERNLPGVYVETADNHSRKTVLKFIREALDQDRNRKTSPEEARSCDFIFYGQSFGGAAAVKLAREIQAWGVSVRLTVQVDSIGKDDDRIPRNVSRALNLYQRDPGPIQGEWHIKADDPSRTEILGNIPFTYLFRDIDLSDYPKAVRRFPISHFKMDNDPAVWAIVETAILGEITAWQASRLFPNSK